MREFINKVGLWAIAIAAFFLPLKTTLSNLGLIIVVVIAVISFATYGGRFYILKSLRFYFFTSIALIIPVVLGLIYTEDMDEGVELLGKQIFFLIAPLVLLAKDFNPKNYGKWVSKGLILGGLMSMLFLHFNNVVNIFDDKASLSDLQFLGYNYTGLKFVDPLKDMHPVYLGSYYLMLLALLWSKEFKLKGFLKITISILTLISIIFLNSRMIFLCLLVMIIGYGIIYYGRVRYYLWIGLAVLFIVGLFIKETYVFNKLVKGTVWELTDNVATEGLDSKKVGDSRMARWKVAVDLIKQKPIFGYGTGTERELLTEAYRKERMEVSYKNKFNAHNQYLGYAIDYGTFGLFFLVMFFLINLKEAIQQKDIQYFMYIFIITTCCLTENFLIRNMGVNFVVIFGLIYTIYAVEKIN